MQVLTSNRNDRDGCAGLACAVRDGSGRKRRRSAGVAVRRRQLLARCAGADLAHPDDRRPRRDRGRARRPMRRAREPTAFALAPGRTPPRRVTRAGTEAIEAIFRFETAEGRGSGVVRLVPDAADGDAPKAWTLLTALDEIKGHEERLGRARPHGRGLFARFPRAELARSAQGRRADMPTAIPPCWSSAADRPGSRSPPGSASCGVDTLIVDRERAHRRQLAQPLSRAGPAQPGARQSPALHAVSAELADLHPEGQARRAGSRPMWRAWSSTTGPAPNSHGGTLRREAAALDGHAAPRRRHDARDASAARRDGDRRQRHSEPPGHSDAGATSPARCCIPASTSDGEAWRASGRSSSAPATAATTSRRTCTASGAQGDAGAAQPDAWSSMSSRARSSPMRSTTKGPPLEDCDLITASTPLALARKSHVDAHRAGEEARPGPARRARAASASGSISATTAPAGSSSI